MCIHIHLLSVNMAVMSSYAASVTFFGVHFKNIPSFHHVIQSLWLGFSSGLVSVFCIEPALQVYWGKRVCAL